MANPARNGVKRCARCNQDKPVDEFSKHALATDGLRPYCRPCHNAMTRVYVQRRREKAKRVVMEAKNRPCADCCQRYPSYVMQFDHVRGEKLFNVSYFRSKAKIDFLLAEIAKCDVVCANCHAIRTHERRAAKAAETP